MAKCTAPVRGHHSAEAEAACPACRYKRSRFSRYSPPPSSYYSPSSFSSSSSNNGGSRSGGSGRTIKPRWSRGGSVQLYTPVEVRALTPVRENVEKRAAAQPDLRDVFLCHAWDDRAGAAKELHDLLEAFGVRVWFTRRMQASASR
jgi:hypothetical protein